jgi:hypothetical protein
VVLVITPVAAPLHGPQLCEFLLPIPEYMGLDATQVTHFTDGEIAFCRNERESIPH